MDGLCPKGYAGTADHPGGCPGQKILEIKNSGRWPHLVGKGEEEEDKWGQAKVVIGAWNRQQFMEEKQFSNKYVLILLRNVATVSEDLINWLQVFYDLFVFGNRTNVVYEDVPENMAAETEERRKELIGQLGTVSPSLYWTVSLHPFWP